MTRAVDSGVVFIARVLMAALFVWGGVMKLLGYGEFVAALQHAYVPFPQFVAPSLVAIEGLGALLLLVGYRVKPLALLLAAYTLLAAIIGHNFWDATSPAVQHDMAAHFWKNVAIAGGFLLLFVTGAGGVSLDGMRRARNYGLLR